MPRMTLLALPLLLAACVPVAMEDAGDGVSVRYHPQLASFRSPDVVAERICAEQGLVAQAIRTDTDSTGIAYAHYACVDDAIAD